MASSDTTGTTDDGGITGDLGSTGDVTSIAGLTGRALAHRAVESALFEIVGGWITMANSGLVRAHAAAWSQHHAWHAELWSARLPRTPLLGDRDRSDGLDPEGDRPLASLLDAPSDDGERIALYADGVLAGLELVLDDQRTAIDPDLDAPTARVLDLVLADVRRDRATALSLADSLGATADAAVVAGARSAVVSLLT